jgi:hypothetical protein
MTTRAKARGAILMVAMVMLAALMAAALLLHAGTRSLTEERERLSERALAQAREALIAYAAERAINASVGPGYLPCPDLDNDGWAESTCGSLVGDTGQEQRLGRLPWKTLGLPDLRDGHGERLWYAVSTKYKGLLNCGVSRACLDMSPVAALGTISVRDASGLVLNDGTIADPAQAASGGAVAVILAPGPPIERSGRMQSRECAPTDCDANGTCIAAPPQRAATCDPANYLDLARGLAGGDEDNAAFVDRSDAAGRPLNRDGFVRGPVSVAGRVVANDRIAVIAYGDVMPRIMRRVALEVAACLRFYASRPENGARYPWTAAACADPAARMADGAGNAEGRIADTPFDATAARAMLPRWWRTAPRSPEVPAELPTRDDACRIAIAPDDAGPARTAPPATPADEASTAGQGAGSWWNAWKPYVTLSIAPAFTPQGPRDAACVAQPCIALVDAEGRTLAPAASAVVAVRRTAAACAAAITQCDAGGCRATLAAGDTAAWLP